MATSKKNKTRSSRMRSKGRRTFRTKNIMNGGFTVYVKDMSNNRYQINIDSSDTISTLKDKVQTSTGISTLQQRLIFAGRNLGEGHNWANSTLGDYNIGPDATIHLVVAAASSPSTWNI